MHFISFIRENKFFLTTCTLVFLLGAYPLLTFSQPDLLVRINNFNHFLLDHFFYYITFFGSFGAYVLSAVALLNKKQNNRAVFIGMSSFITVSAIVQGMKRILFSDHLRPIVLLPNDTPLHLVKGVVLHTRLTFPSGHAATVATAACLIYLLTRKRGYLLGASLLLLTIAVAYSRMYLCQHFYKDVYVGALIGTWTTVLLYAFLIHWKGPLWLEQTPWELVCTKSKRQAQ